MIPLHISNFYSLFTTITKLLLLHLFPSQQVIPNMYFLYNAAALTRYINLKKVNSFQWSLYICICISTVLSWFHCILLSPPTTKNLLPNAHSSKFDNWHNSVNTYLMDNSYHIVYYTVHLILSLLLTSHRRESILLQVKFLFLCLFVHVMKNFQQTSNTPCLSLTTVRTILKHNTP